MSSSILDRFDFYKIRDETRNETNENILNTEIKIYVYLFIGMCVLQPMNVHFCVTVCPVI